MRGKADHLDEPSRPGAPTQPSPAELLVKMNEAQHLARIGSWDWDIGSGGIWWSDETYRIFGVTREEHVPHFENNAKFIHPDDLEAYRRNFAHSLETGDALDFDVRLCTNDGHIKTCRAQGKVVLSDGGKPSRFIGTLQDITALRSAEQEQRNLEAQLIQSQKMESVGRLAGGLAHDFNNLLTVILSDAELLLLENDGPEGAPSREAILEIRTAVEHARSLTQRLLAFSRKQVLELTRLDLNRALVELEKMISRLIGKDIALVTTLSEAPVEIEVDKSQLDQIVLNLAVNARDAMPRGGRIMLRCANAVVEERAGGDLEKAPPGEYAELLFQDTGCGMGPDVICHIFEPFFSTKAPGRGTGLGLSTVYGIVRQHGGFIEVESEVGVGTTFRILLPSARPLPG